MDDFTTYKLQRKPKRNLMPPPSYCHKFEQQLDIASTENATRTIEVSDVGAILLLLESLSDSNTIKLEKKINDYIQDVLVARYVFIVTLVFSVDEAVVQVIGQNELDPEFRTPVKKHIFMEAIHKKECILNYLHQYDSTFQLILQDMLGETTDPSTHEIVTVPIIKTSTCTNVPILVCVVDSPKPMDFISKFINETFRFCLPILLNTSKFEEEARIKRQCQSLLSVARRLFGHLDDLHDLLKEIMMEARTLTNSERCSLFLMDPDQVHLVAKVFDGGVAEDIFDPTKVILSLDQGIAGHVAATGKILNIKDAYQHPLFYKGMDEATGFKTRNILCFPIRNETGIVGVAQLCNKITGDFDVFDEEVALAFSIYCGLSIMHSIVYKRIKEAQFRSKLSNELMLYHMKVYQIDIENILLCTNRHDYLDYDMFHFSPKRVPITETTCQILRMFEDLKFFDNFHIDREVLVRFLLYVQKGYRDTPYHNWMHAFSTAHFAYVAMKQLKLIDNGYLTFLEALAYIISCICHDIDHRGTTNSFQLKTQSVLASLYSSEGSVMEHHHVSQTMCILNTEECNFVSNLSDDDYRNFLALIKDMILATDLAIHFQLAEQQEEMIAQAGYQQDNVEHRQIFRSLLMTCADLSDQIKEWHVITIVAQQIYEEFFRQGDIEKEMGGKPAVMMDRKQADIPGLQLEFLERVCLPVFLKLKGLFPEHNVTGNLEQNIECWKVCKPIFEKFKREGRTSLTLLLSDEVEEEVKKILSTANELEEDELFCPDSELVLSTIDGDTDSM